MTGAPRVVLDTNVVLSALIFSQGRLAGFRKAWQVGRIRALISSVTTRELVRALSYPKFKLSSAGQQELLADYLPHCTAIHLPSRAPKIPVCRDPDDRSFLELAMAGKADYLVSGDKDLISLGVVGRCPIVTPARFLDELKVG